MSTESWLLLTDYSSKYRISVSTLRRRIKSEQIPYKFEHGKYLLLDAPPSEAVEQAPRFSFSANRDARQPIPETMPLTTQFEQAAEPVPLRSPFASTPGLPKSDVEVPLAQETAAAAELENHGGQDEPIISTATKLLSELKRAYMNILQEKESQLIQLKEEVSDLKTLVRVLEDENDRLRAILGMGKVL